MSRTKKDVETQRQRLFDTESLMLKREKILEDRINSFESKENDFKQKVDKLKDIKANLETWQSWKMNGLAINPLRILLKPLSKITQYFKIFGVHFVNTPRVPGADP